jgi:hypothetical protein
MKPFQNFFCIHLIFSSHPLISSPLLEGTIISSFEIESQLIVAYLYQIFLILSEKKAVASDPKISKLLARIFLTTHLANVSLIKPSSSGTISLKKSLPRVVFSTFPLTLTLIGEFRVIAQPS